MRKSICIIDDSIPVDDYPKFIESTALIDETALKYLCNHHEQWPEEPLKGLVNEITTNHKDWGISAFHNPTFYFNHIDAEIYSPEIIIFDWDYAGETVATDEHLLHILESTYSVVGIFTGADKKAEIQEILEHERFKNYSNRVHLVEKGEANAVSEIISKTNQKFDSHFSYKFGKELKFNSIKSLDDILVSISSLSYDEFICAFGHKRENGSTEISIKEFVEIISEKFKNHLANIEFTEGEIKPVDCTNVKVDDISRLWSYRMYYSPKDDLVRTGDIIKLAGSDEYTKYLVVSADCHLLSFWRKNFGNLALVPMHEKNNANANLKNKLKLNAGLSRYNEKSIRVTSVSNSWVQESLSIVSSVPLIINDQLEFKDYVIFPKEIRTVYIPPPVDDLSDANLGIVRNLRLLYSHFSDKVDPGNRLNLNEPFRTPLIQFALNNISGYGSPDYPHSLQEVIKAKKLEE